MERWTDGLFVNPPGVTPHDDFPDDDRSLLYRGGPSVDEVTRYCYRQYGEMNETPNPESSIRITGQMNGSWIMARQIMDHDDVQDLFEFNSRFLLTRNWSYSSLWWNTCNRVANKAPGCGYTP